MHTVPCDQHFIAVGRVPSDGQLHSTQSELAQLSFVIPTTQDILPKEVRVWHSGQPLKQPPTTHAVKSTGCVDEPRTLEATEPCGDEVLATWRPNDGVCSNLLVAMHLRQLAFDVAKDLEGDARCLAHEDSKLAANRLKSDVLDLVLNLQHTRQNKTRESSKTRVRL